MKSEQKVCNLPGLIGAVLEGEAELGGGHKGKKFYTPSKWRGCRGTSPLDKEKWASLAGLMYAGGMEWRMDGMEDVCQHCLSGQGTRSASLLGLMGLQMHWGQNLPCRPRDRPRPFRTNSKTHQRIDSASYPN